VGVFFVLNVFFAFDHSQLVFPAVFAEQKKHNQLGQLGKDAYLVAFVVLVVE